MRPSRCAISRSAVIRDGIVSAEVRPHTRIRARILGEQRGKPGGGSSFAQLRDREESQTSLAIGDIDESKFGLARSVRRGDKVGGRGSREAIAMKAVNRGCGGGSWAARGGDTLRVSRGTRRRGARLRSARGAATGGRVWMVRSESAQSRPDFRVLRERSEIRQLGAEQCRVVTLPPPVGWGLRRHTTDGQASRRT